MCICCGISGPPICRCYCNVGLNFGGPCTNCGHTVHYDPPDWYVKKAKEDFVAWYNKGQALFELGKYDEAIECYDKALEASFEGDWRYDKRYSNALRNKGLALLNLGKYHEALLAFKGKMGHFPWDADLAGGSWDEQIRFCNKILEIDPRCAEAWLYKGQAIAQNRNPGFENGSIRCYDKALAIDPNYVDVLHAKGLVLSALGKDKEAQECLVRAKKVGAGIL